MDGVIHTNSKNGASNQGLDQFANLSPLQRQIMMFVHSAPPTNEGVHVQSIAQGIQASSGSVLQAVEQLTTDGMLYTTIDDDHVRFPLSQTLMSVIGEEYSGMMLRFLQGIVMTSALQSSKYIMDLGWHMITLEGPFERAKFQVIDSNRIVARVLYHVQSLSKVVHSEISFKLLNKDKPFLQHQSHSPQ